MRYSDAKQQVLKIRHLGGTDLPRPRRQFMGRSKRHVEQVKEQMSRRPFTLPYLDLSDVKDIWSAQMDDIRLMNYEHHPAITAEMAV